LRINKYIKSFIFIYLEKMEKVFVIAFIITTIFVVAKIVEMKFIDKEMKPMKDFIRETSFVSGSSILGAFIYLNMDSSLMNFMNTMTNNKSFNMSTTQVFTDEPGF
jgi:hypothetical protein